MDPLTPPVLLLPDAAVAGDDPVRGFAPPSGWRVQPGFELTAEPWDLRSECLMCVGTVEDEDDARAAMTVAARGGGLALRITLRGSARHRFLEDLHKVSQPVPYEPPTTGVATHLSTSQQELLAALAAGSTVTAAADALHVSRRTANRLLADARSQLGAETNVGAVHRWISERGQ